MPFYPAVPMSSFGVVKLNVCWFTVDYRDTYDMRAMHWHPASTTGGHNVVKRL